MLTLLLSIALVAEAWKSTPLPGPMPAPTQQALVEVNGIKLFYATYGTGAPLVLLHGGAGNGEHWAQQVPALAAKFTVIVVDARGHGRSTRDTRPMSYALMADDLLALMDVLKLDQAALLGWSDGGAVALDLALRHPERVSKLIAYGTNYHFSGTQKGGGGAAFAAYFARCAADYARLSPTPGDFQGLQAALRPMWRTLPRYTDAQLAGLSVPTLVLDGDHDEIIRADHLKALARLVPGARLVWIPQSSHFALFQQPEAFNRAVLDFLTASP